MRAPLLLVAVVVLAAAVASPLATSEAYDGGSLSAGDIHTCGLAAGGVKCWGWNGFGQLGNNSTTTSSIPVDVGSLGSGVAAVSAGNVHTCALTTGGGVKCWGYNGSGQLGNNSTTDSHVPVDVSGLTSGVQAISAGAFHSCALTVIGGVKCWGQNTSGQLGNNSTVESHVPVDVSGLGGVAVLSAGIYHTCAVTTGGGARCWGLNSLGQLGNDSTANSRVPVDVSGLASSVQAVTASGAHTCALTTGGGVKCWGGNAFGELGNNSTIESHVAVDVSGLAGGVAAVSAGWSHTCALSAGGVRCWGNNVHGALGNDSTTNSSVPVNVSGLGSGVAAVSAGSGYTCALMTGGGVKCWGDNGAGKLGNNSTTDSTVPVDVVGLQTTPRLEVRKFLWPLRDRGRFSLWIDGEKEASNGGTTGELTVEPGEHAVKETGSSLSKYFTSVTCRDEDGSGDVVFSGIGPGPHTVDVGGGADVVCVFRNVRKPGS